MKIPCEIVVWSVLPMIRREVSKELVNTHGMTQAEVARRFGVTDAAISQYLKKKRGGNALVDDSPLYPQFQEEVRVSAARIAEDKSDFASEMCRLCCVVKKTGLLAIIYKAQTGVAPPQCAFEEGELAGFTPQ